MMRRLRHQYVIILKVITFVIDFHNRLGNTNVMLSVTSIFTHILEMLPAINISSSPRPQSPTLRSAGSREKDLDISLESQSK